MGFIDGTYVDADIPFYMAGKECKSREVPVRLFLKVDKEFVEKILSLMLVPKERI